MFNLTEIIFSFIAYMLFLFVLALISEKYEKQWKLSHSPYIYAFSLAIYCTAWTYYGSVGKVSTDGFLFLSVYLGPTLILFLWPLIIKRLILLKEKYKITSVADLISARYNNSIYIGAFVSFCIIAGIIPYISIQLKAIIQSIEILTANQMSSSPISIDSVGILIVILMSFFTIIFGLRRLDPSERHFGIVFIVAVESLVKLVALIIIGIFVSYFVFDDIATLFRQAQDNGTLQILTQQHSNINFSNWFSLIVLSMFAFIFLPRQFHISVVENSSSNHIKTAMWLFPLYLLIITFFTVPIALGGSILNIDHTLRDFYVLTIPLSQENASLSLLAFIGGFSASTSMIMVTSVAIAIMVSNYLILPIIESFNILRFLKKRLLLIRWIFVTLLIFLSYIFYLYVSKDNLIVNIGLISFAAILQLAPAVLAALFWKEANTKGAFSALVIGFSIWFYTLIIPQFVNSQWIPANIIHFGPFGIEFLNPTALFGLTAFDSIPHSLFWSMLFNISALIFVSLLTQKKEEEINSAENFVDIFSEQNSLKSYSSEATILTLEKTKQIKTILSQYFHDNNVQKITSQINEKFHLDKQEFITIIQLFEIYEFLKITLTGTLGSTGANQILKRNSIFSEEENEQLTKMYTHVLNEKKISPLEFSKKINYFKEKEALLQQHQTELENKIQEKTQHLEDSIIKMENIQMNVMNKEKIANIGELINNILQEAHLPLDDSFSQVNQHILNAKKVITQFKSKEIDEEDLELFLEEIPTILQELKSNLTLSQEILQNFKHIAFEQTHDNKKAIFLKKHLEEIILSFQTLLQKKNVTVILNCDDSLQLNTYPGSISQVFTNLILNALTHAFHNQSNNKIIITVKKEHEIIYIDFADNGIGIKEEQLQTLFQSNSFDSSENKFGLKIVQNILETKLQSSITCESQYKFGTCFHIQLNPIMAPFL